MVSIHLEDRIATALTAQAEAKGMTLDAYLSHLACDNGLDSEPTGRLPRLTGADFDALIESEASDGAPYSGSYPRSDIYEGRP
ncbi:hypothetical protein Pla175_03410 [Pirellulimonas nuda]|uniref:Uncharacterized protein n=1 Tax=Pirellulimonas nuda TaxID=2528009 RepID=A0A518D692_9BACT|nr:hypothetical protein [Pirellulimonas nuda]QDU86987.1 hypothetical protein Pla175_03410 [Pirellulimonas nuda]